MNKTVFVKFYTVLSVQYEYIQKEIIPEKEFR